MFRRKNFLPCHPRDSYCLVLGLQLGSKVHKNQFPLDDLLVNCIKRSYDPVYMFFV